MAKTISKIRRKGRTEPVIRSLSKENVSAIRDKKMDGIKFHAFAKLTGNIPISLHNWAKYLSLSERTLQRFKAGNLKFNSLQSGKILEIIKLYQHGKEVFGNDTDFDSWMKSYCMALGGIKPEELLDEPLGIEKLNDELGRIEYGIFA